nr:MAG TPA: hypothetical protein [Crassvirales sp.]
MNFSSHGYYSPSQLYPLPSRMSSVLETTLYHYHFL